jgi:branched-chain amino acid transport system ATP-binding protein
MILKVEELNVFYGGMQALFGIDLQVSEGEIVSILGSNGAGKSTLINAISGLRNVPSGRIEYEGTDITKLPPYKRVDLGIVQVPEGRRLFPLMSVEENLMMGSINATAKKVRQQTLEQVYRFLPRLYERRKQVASTLSGGEQQMVAIGRALMAKPKLMMFDEPSLGLAPKLVGEVFQLIKRIPPMGVTVLLVEQNVKQTLNIADRTYVFENGHVIMEGQSHSLLSDEKIKKAFLGM